MITYPNLYYLKYFVDAVELESISGSAQRNSVSHPAVSRAISSLEKHLGVKLLEHQKRSFKVTNAGYQVAKQARTLLSSAKAFNAFSLDEVGEPLRLNIGISRSLSSYYLSPLIKDIKANFIGAEVHIRFGTTLEITEAVAKKSLDIGITIGTQNLPTLKQTPIRNGKYLIIESSANKGTRENWDAKSFILTEPRSETETLKQEYQKQFGKALPVLVEVGSWEVISQLVQEGLGTGLVPDVTLKAGRNQAFRILRPAWFDSDYEVYIHHLKQRSSHRIIEYVRDWLLKKK